jgi:hypothetical protein
MILKRGEFIVDISSKNGSNRTFKVWIQQYSDNSHTDTKLISSKTCICIGAIKELERYFDDTDNIMKVLSSGASKFKFELVPIV